MNEANVHTAPRSATEYIEGLPEDRARDIETVRRVILEHLPEGYQEEIGFGMITYVIPLTRYPGDLQQATVDVRRLGIPQKLHVGLSDERLRRPANGTVVYRSLPGQRQEAEHGQVMRPVQETG